jgi:singapore isolate B (sub-type 7) whole genome shotgun sequence assembly, scaffold_1
MQKTWSRSGNQMVMSTALEKVEREIALMKRLRHPNLVRLIDVVDDEEQDQSVRRNWHDS